MTLMRDTGLIDTAGAAQTAGVSVRTIQTWTRIGLLPAVRTGGRGRGDMNLYRPEDVLAAEQAMAVRRTRPPAARAIVA